MESNKSSSILLSITLIITGFATLVLGNYLIYTFALATNPNYDGIAAYGTLTFTGNASCGELVNITNSAGNLAVFQMNITGAINGGFNCSLVPAEYIAVNMPALWNDSATATTNLTTALNANVTVTNFVTISNPSTTSVRLTGGIGRSSNNRGTLLETLANAAWGNSSLLGGQDAVIGQAATLSYATIVLPLFGIVLMLFGFVSLLASITGLSSTVSGFSIGKGKSGGGGSTGTSSERNSRSSSSGDERG